MSLPSQMRAVVIDQQHGSFTPKQVPVPQPGQGQVLVRVHACGVCGGDHVIHHGLMPQASYPRVPGHEVTGEVVALGPGAKRWKVGDRVGRGWAGGHCFSCRPCRRGQFLFCESGSITGCSVDGGWAEYMLAPWESLAALPDGLSYAAAAPLLCAGTTTFNSLRRLGLAQGSWVAVLGVGGLGHLAVQFASRMGFRVLALSSSDDKRELALQLGARHFLATGKDAASMAAAIKEIMSLTRGAGLDLLMDTTGDGRTTSPLVEALGVGGKLLCLGAGAHAMQVHAAQLLHNNRSLVGWSSGYAQDGEECLEFAAEWDIRVMSQTFPLEQAQEAYDAMNANKLRFRAVLLPGGKE